MIDARIDKALARLVSLQEYERVRATYSPPTHSCVTYGPYVTQNRKEGPHMSTKSALRADLDAEDG